MTFMLLLAAWLAGSLHAKLYGKMPQSTLVAADVSIFAAVLVTWWLNA